MSDNPIYSRYLQITMKVIAALCGLTLLFSAAQSQVIGLDGEGLLQFFLSQIQNPVQFKLLVGLAFLVAGICFPMPQKSSARLSGPKDLQSSAYRLYLVNKYKIERNVVLNQLVCRDTVFVSLEEALSYAHALECPPQYPSYKAPTLDSLKDSFLETSSELAKVANTESPENASLTVGQESRNPLPIPMMIGSLLYLIILGGMFYALSQNIVSTEIVEFSKAPEVQSPVEANSSNPNASAEAPSSDAVPAELTAQTVAINERWLGVWASEGSTQKLSITSTAVKYGNDEFLWVGVRPKGVVKCCPAFYEGSTNKAELLARMQAQQALLETPTIDSQKIVVLVNNLGQGNFKKIVLADPFLRKYFFIYDQNYVYRVGRDVGDKSPFIFEQFKRQE
ncbi:hypothetical protein C2759_02510 [Polynucleobacter sp. MG-Unter2-18]|uniref:hypothetical protein n=1 Tax=Polynucleobacter sp. MG-Unter2-18 TaxID=2081052 RepID=UPI001BFD22DF|nr:hypothetical protein [Polynucleobacter sp. MG-Unter2-18]QWD95028.1 hypothetical protein C2759_02510 [Polynucleobacter sp. MG-Unter2-18]